MILISSEIFSFYTSISSSVTASEDEADSEAAAAADGGFVLYPNMSNTNQLQSVYRK